VRYGSLVATSLGLALSVPALAGDPPVQVLEPASSWTLNYDPEQCALMRDFGPEDNRLRLQIESYGSMTDFRLLLAGKPVPRSHGPQGLVRYAFPNDTAERAETGSIEGTTGPNTAAISFSAGFTPYDPDYDYAHLPIMAQLERSAQPKAPAPEFEQGVDRIAITIGNRARLDLHLGKMGKPLEAMRKCVEDLQRSWGLDPALQARLTRNPVPYPSTVRNVQSDYPPSMVLKGRSAFVPVRIMVDAQGQTTACTVQVPQIESAFTKAVCDHLQGRFYPAVDDAGNAVASVYRTSVIYMLSR
jgi:hypothetical protein